MTETVDHELYGTGVVQARRYRGLELLVHFSCGIRRWIPRSELRAPPDRDIPPDRGSALAIEPESPPVGARDRDIPPGRDSALAIEPASPPVGARDRDIPPGRDSALVVEPASPPAGARDRDIPPGRGSALAIESASLPAVYPGPLQGAGASGAPVITGAVLEGRIPSQIYAGRRAPPSRGEARHEARAIIEALRQGGVPREKVEHFTAGRDGELEEIREWLGSGDGCLRIDGDYGVGKSHLLELTASHALHDGWAVARVEIDPNETPFHRPKRLYQSIIQSLEYRSGDQIRTFSDLMTFVAGSSGDMQAVEAHPYFGAFIRYWKADSDNEELWDWIRGDSDPYQSYLPRLLDFQLAANICCNLLSGLGWIAKNVLGLRGLLILIDEAESIDKSFYTNYQHRMALNTLKGLIFTANSEKSLIEEAIKRQIGGGCLGRYSDLRYPGYRQYQFPYIWKEETGMKIVFAFVPEFFESLAYDSDAYLAITGMPSLKIEPLSRTEHARLFRRIVDIYREAYNFEPQRIALKLLPKEKTRFFLKATVEALDLMRFHPGQELQDLIIHDTEE
ncbi:MAG: DUF2791 family P-loop domain-containing protein [Methanomicrobiales archaeon]|nr:DUF2791 family P-loop domain-containing protein [Methanomicrobiales archaeon]